MGGSELGAPSSSTGLRITKEGTAIGCGETPPPPLMNDAVKDEPTLKPPRDKLVFSLPTSEDLPPPPPDVSGAPLYHILFEAGPLGLLLKDSSLGLVVVAVRPGGAAATRGVLRGDVVAEINEQRVARDETEAVFSARVKAAAGRPLELALRRSPPRAAEVLALLAEKREREGGAGGGSRMLVRSVRLGLGCMTEMMEALLACGPAAPAEAHDDMPQEAKDATDGTIKEGISRLGQELVCAVCADVFDDPQILPCGRECFLSLSHH